MYGINISLYVSLVSSLHPHPLWLGSQFDLRNLLVVNPHRVDEEPLTRQAGVYLERQAQAVVQSLINRFVCRRTLYRCGVDGEIYTAGHKTL